MEEISKDVFVYHFKCKDFKVKNWMPGTRWFGRHFTLGFVEHHDLKRLYTTIQAYSKNNQQQLKALLHYYDKLRNNQRDFHPNCRPIENE